MFFRSDSRTKERFCVMCETQAAKDPDFTVLKYSGSTGTNILQRHLYRYHLKEWVTQCDEKKLVINGEEARAVVADYRRQMGQSLEVNDGSTQARRAFTHENFTAAITKFVVSDDQAMNILENVHFRSLLLLMRSDLRDSDIPHRTFLRTRILSNWKQHLIDLRNEMKRPGGRISLTMDLWSDENLSPFMAVTAHCVDMVEVSGPAGSRTILQLQSYLIGFHRIPGRHTGDHLAQMLMHLLDRLEMSQKIGWITLDNASNNDTCITSLAEELTSRGISGFDAAERRIRCFPHIVNLACQAIISKVTDLRWASTTADDYVPATGAGQQERDVIAVLRSAIRAIRSSSLRRDAFADTCRRLGLQDHELIRDVDTRWSSTYLMILRALKLQQAIDRYLTLASDLQRYRLQRQDWVDLKCYARILAVPHAFQQVLSAEKTPTLCGAMPAFNAMISRWRELQEQLPLGRYYETIQAGIEKLQHYHDRLTLVPAYTLSILINPAMKLNWFRENMPGEVEEVRELFIAHLSQYHDFTEPSTRGPQVSATDNDFDFHDDPNLILGLHNLSLLTPEDHNLRTEVESYFLDPYQSTSSLTFWQENRSRYPTIFLLALDILSIQGSAVPCERIFSSAKETMTLRRNRIAPELMEALQMLKYSYNHGYKLNFTAGLSQNEEYAHLMELTMEESQVPEDVTSFMDSLKTPALIP